MTNTSKEIQKLIESSGARTAQLVKIALSLNPDDEDLVNKAGQAGISLFLNDIGKLMEKDRSESN